MKRDTARKVLRLAVQQLLALALVFVAAEIVFRFFLQTSDSPFHAFHRSELDRPWLFSLKPDTTTRFDWSPDVSYFVNEAGFRGPAVPLEKTEENPRVLVIGDSVAFGYGFNDEDTFPRLMESDDQGNRDLEVLNFGVSGYNAYNEEAVLREKGMTYKPDVVLVQFCTNDLNVPTRHYSVQSGIRPESIPDAAFPDPNERGPVDPPNTLCLRRPCECSELCLEARRAFLQWRDGPTKPTVDFAAVGYRELPEGTSRNWLGDLYEQMAETAEAGGARFAVVAVPSRDQLFIPTQLQGQLTELGEERGFEVINLLPALYKGQGKESLYADQWHLTKAGHRITAEAIRSELQSRGWIDGPSPP